MLPIEQETTVDVVEDRSGMGFDVRVMGWVEIDDALPLDGHEQVSECAVVASGTACVLPAGVTHVVIHAVEGMELHVALIEA